MSLWWAVGLQIEAAPLREIQVALMPVPLSPGGVTTPGGLQPLLTAFIEALSCLPHSDLRLLDGFVQGGIARLFRLFIEFAQQDLEPLDLRLDLLPHGIGPLACGMDLGQLSLHKGPLGLEGVRSPANGAEILIDLQGSLTGGAGLVTSSFPLALQLFQAIQKGFPCGPGLFLFCPQLDRRGGRCGDAELQRAIGQADEGRRHEGQIRVGQDEVRQGLVGTAEGPVHEGLQRPSGGSPANVVPEGLATFGGRGRR